MTATVRRRATICLTAVLASAGAAIVGAKVYWGSGYRGGQNDKLYAFGIPAARLQFSGGLKVNRVGDPVKSLESRANTHSGWTLKTLFDTGLTMSIP